MPMATIYPYMVRIAEKPHPFLRKNFLAGTDGADPSLQAQEALGSGNASSMSPRSKPQRGPAVTG